MVVAGLDADESDVVAALSNNLAYFNIIKCIQFDNIISFLFLYINTVSVAIIPVGEV